MASVIKNDRWVKRWEVPKSSGDGNWIVAIDKNGNYGCSCPVWKFKRQECHHIKLIKMGGGDKVTPKAKAKYVLAKVYKPTYKEETNELLVPLVAIPDALMMEATICYYMLKYGFSMGEIREIRQIPQSWTGRAIFAHIEHHGEREYPKDWYNCPLGTGRNG